MATDRASVRRGPRCAARTPNRRRATPAASGPRAARSSLAGTDADACGSDTVPRVNAFEVIGIILIVWAIVVGVLGITRENFPGNAGTERIVGAVSVILVLLAIGAALYTGATEEEEEHEKGEHGAVTFLGA